MGLRIRLLRDLAIERDGTRVADPLTPKARSLLAILALRHGHPVPIDELIDRLWPGREHARAVDSLRVHVSQLRGALGDAKLIEGATERVPPR